jgi:hypothetical protein
MKEPKSYILYGDEADFARVAIDEWLQARNHLNSLKTGISPQKLQVIAPSIQRLTEIDARTKVLTAKTKLTNEEENEAKVLSNESIQISVDLMQKAPEMLNVVQQTRGPEVQKEIKELEKSIIEQRKEIIASILKALDPAISQEEFDSWKLTSLEKEKFIYKVAEEPENNMDASFLVMMEKLSPLVTLFH